MLGVVALFSLAAYLITPETAAGPNGDPGGFAFNLRYLAPALALSLAVAPLAPALAGPRARTGTVAVLAVVLAGTVAEPRLWPSAHAGGAIVIGVAAVAVLGLIVLGGRSRTRIAIAVAAAVAVGIVIAGYPLQRHYLHGRYAYQPNVSYLARVWALFRTVHNSRVGVVGTFGGFFSYPFVRGRRLEPRDLRRPAWTAWVVHAHRHLRSMAGPGELRPPEIPNHHTSTRPLAPRRAHVLARNPVDGDRPRGHARVHRTGAGPADRGVSHPRPARPGRVSRELKVSSVYMTTAADPLNDPELLDTEWDLGPLVDGEGRAGAERMLEEGKERASKFQAEYAGKVAGLDPAALQDAMRELEEINELVGRAGSYASLEFATDTADPSRGALLQLVQERATEIETLLLFFELEWAAVDDDEADELLASDKLDRYRHHLRSVRRYRPHLLSESEEKILAEKSISSQAAWGRLFGELCAAIRVDLDDTELTLEVALSRLQSSDRELRRAAADAVSTALEPGLRTRGFIYNTLVFDKSVEDRLRRYPNWLASRNLANEASDESVMALIEAVRGRYDIPQRWYRLKAKLIGVDRLADYDRSAPVLAEDIVVLVGRGPRPRARHLPVVLTRRGRGHAAVLRRPLDRRAGPAAQARRRLLRLHRAERAPIRDAQLHRHAPRRADDGARARPRPACLARPAPGRVSPVHAPDPGRDRVGVR